MKTLLIALPLIAALFLTGCEGPSGSGPTKAEKEAALNAQMDNLGNDEAISENYN